MRMTGFASVVIGFKNFQQLIQSAAAVGDEIQVRIRKDGLKIQQLDQNHYLMGILELKSEYLRDFSYPFEDEICVAIPAHLIKKYKKADTVEIVASPEDSKIKFFEFYGQLIGEEKLYNVRVVKHFSDLKSDFDAYIQVYIKPLVAILKTANYINDHMIFDVNESNVTFSTAKERVEFKISSPQGSDIVYTIDVKRSAKVALNNVLLIRILRALSSIANSAVIKIETNRPARIEAVSYISPISAYYYLAPMSL